MTKAYCCGKMFVVNLLISKKRKIIMVLKKDAILTVIKSVDPTMQAAGFELVSPKKPSDDDNELVFSGESGRITAEINGNVLKLTCNKTGEEINSTSSMLFAYEEEDWDSKDSKSVANEMAETVSKYYGTKLVYDNQETKKGNEKKGKGAAKASDQSTSKPVKKSKKKDSASYEPWNLASRVENIFPELKGKMDENMEEYSMFLPEEYFEKVATPRILEAIRTQDRQSLKKLFNSFNTFYDEGTKDVQSLISVSILGMNLVKEKELLDNCVDYMNEDLQDAVIPVVKYLSSPVGKTKIKAFENPKPFKGKKK